MTRPVEQMIQLGWAWTSLCLFKTMRHIIFTWHLRNNFHAALPSETAVLDVCLLMTGIQKVQWGIERGQSVTLSQVAREMEGAYQEEEGGPGHVASDVLT